MGRKRKVDEDDDQYDPPSSHLSVSHVVKQEKRLIIILEGAQLETTKVSVLFSSFWLINDEIHRIIRFFVGWYNL